MLEASIVFSRKGLFKSVIAARDVRSREHARKLWPLVDPDSHCLVTWVSPSFEGEALRRVSHFRLLTGVKPFNPKAQFSLEEDERCRSVGESPEHVKAKDLLAAELERRRANKLAMPWAFKDDEVSDFPFKGDLLLGAVTVKQEEIIETSFGCSFRLDIAVVGLSARNNPMVFGGIEIERNHAFDGRKALLAKSIGFPLISVDISNVSLDQLTPDWAGRVLSQTTKCNPQGRRWTYVYLHDLLYPLFSQFPNFVDPKRRHQYLVFADNQTLDKLVKWITEIGNLLRYSRGELAVALVNSRNDQSEKMLITAGEIVGNGWRDINEQRCLRITLPRPLGRGDTRAFQLHLNLARLLLSHADALVGYQYSNQISNDEPTQDIWVYKHWSLDEKAYIPYRILPKRLAEPMSQIVRVINSLPRSASDND